MKEKIVESLSVQNFDDGILKTVGSAEWKALINAAKVLYEKERAVDADKDLDHCMLCHQKLTKEAKSLFLNIGSF